MKYHLFATVGSLLLAGSGVSANAYDDCIFQYIGNVQNPAAVSVLKESCISNVSIYADPFQVADMSKHVFLVSVGSFNVGYTSPFKGLLIRVENILQNPITEISLGLRHKNTNIESRYTTNDFSANIDYGGIRTGPGDPILEHAIAPGHFSTFVFEVPGIENSLPAFLAAYDWYVLNLKVIPSS